MALSDGERRICDAVAERRDELVALASELIGFDTTARTVGEPPREETALQEFLAERLRGTGAEIDLWEPDADALAGKPLVPPGLDFVGRPQLIARRRGARPADGRSSSTATSTSSRSSRATAGRARRSPRRSATGSCTAAAPAT